MGISLECFMYGVRFRRLMNERLDDSIRQFGLVTIDASILYYLYKDPERDTARDILDLGLFTKGHISQSLARLEEKGFLVIRQDENDRRISHLILTEQAQPVIDEIGKRISEAFEIAFAGISEEERRMLGDIADRINRNIREAL